MSGEHTFSLTGPTGLTLDAYTFPAELGEYVPATVNRLEFFDGWFDGVDQRSENVSMLYDGEVASPVRATGRKMSAAGIYTGLTPQQVVGMQRLIGGIWGDSTNDSYGTLTGSVSGETLTAPQVRKGGATKLTGNRDAGYVIWQLEIYSPKPWLYGAERTYQLQPDGTGGGMVFPLNGGPNGEMQFGNGSADSSRLLQNFGNATAFPVFQVNGDFASGFRVQVSNKIVEYPFTVYPQSPVTVDMAGRVIVNGRNQARRLSLRSWGSIPPQSSAIARFTPLQSNGTGFCQVTVRDTFI